MQVPKGDLRHFLQSHLDVGNESAGEVVPQLLRSLRQHLGLDVAFVSRFQDGRRIFQFVDTAGEAPPVRSGESDSLEQSYCQRVVDGRLPELIPDVTHAPEAAALPVTKTMNIGSYIGVPIRMSDGSLYGTFCCAGTKADPSLRQRDLELVRIFADVTGQLLEQELRFTREAAAIRERTHRVLEQGRMSMVFQPIRHLTQERTLGVEALARFEEGDGQGPDIWFNQAARVGMGAALELHAIEMALAALPQLPQDMYLSCNVSPEVAMEEGLRRMVERSQPERIMLELTEHMSVNNYDRLSQALAPLRQIGMRLAVDDAGAGHSSFRHILTLQPDVIKLDMSLTHQVDTHAGRRALAAALIRFAEETGSQLVAEGVETEGELQALCALGAHVAQGYHVSRPQPLAKLLEQVGSERGA